MKDNLNLITGCDDGHIYKVKMIKSMKPAHFKAHGEGVIFYNVNQVSGLVLSKDEKFIVSGSYDDTVAIWDARTFENLHRLNSTTNVKQF